MVDRFISLMELLGSMFIKEWGGSVKRHHKNGWMSFLVIRLDRSFEAGSFANTPKPNTTLTRILIIPLEQHSRLTWIVHIDMHPKGVCKPARQGLLRKHLGEQFAVYRLGRVFAHHQLQSEANEGFQFAQRWVNMFWLAQGWRQIWWKFYHLQVWSLLIIFPGVLSRMGNIKAM